MAELATFKYLSDGTPIRIDSSDPDVIARTLKEKELEAKISKDNTDALTDIYKIKSTEKNNSIDNLVKNAKISAENLKTLRS